MKEENLNIEKHLEVLKRKDLFKVPENYFDDFAARLQKRIERENRTFKKISWIDYYLKPALGIAAVFTVLFLAVYIPVSKTFKGQKMSAANTEKTVIIDNKSQSEEQGAYEALAMLPQSQFLSTLEGIETQEDVTALDQKDLEEYLAENTSDYDLLTNN